MAKIFISYHREEAETPALLIKERLASKFGMDNVFFDVHDVRVGKCFPEQIDLAIAQSHALVAVIGPDWLRILKEREAQGKKDWVRYEITQALKKPVPVVPVYVKGAPLLKEDELPSDLKRLDSYDALEVHGGKNFESDLGLLVTEVSKTLAMHTEEAPRSPAKFRAQRRGRIATAVLLFLVAALYVYDEYVPGRIDKTNLARLLHGHQWVAYDPPRFDESVDAKELFRERVSLDLRIIQDVGFTGLFVIGDASTSDIVPQLAKENGLALIFGVWDPTSRAELAKAVRIRHWVDAYVVGYNGERENDMIDAVEHAVWRLRKRTGRPVSTTRESRQYINNNRLAECGDWLFPDVHLTFSTNSSGESFLDVERDIRRFRDLIRPLAEWAKSLDKPLALNAVAYPIAGVKGASREIQARFYAGFIEALADPERGIPVRASIVPHSAFDVPWKTNYPFYSWSPYCGLIETNGLPRIAVKAILERLQRP